MTLLFPYSLSPFLTHSLFLFIYRREWFQCRRGQSCFCNFALLVQRQYLGISHSHSAMQTCGTKVSGSQQIVFLQYSAPLYVLSPSGGIGGGEAVPGGRTEQLDWHLSCGNKNSKSPLWFQPQIYDITLSYTRFKIFSSCSWKWPLMTVFWSNKHQTFRKGKSNYVLNVLSSDIELGIYLTTGLMMNHHSQNLFYKLKLACGVFIRDLTRKKAGKSPGTQAANCKLLTCSFRQIFPLAGLAKQITMQSVYSWVCKSEWNLFPLQMHCIYEYVKARSKSQSLGLCFDLVKFRSFETEGNSGSDLPSGLLVVITR